MKSDTTKMYLTRLQRLGVLVVPWSFVLVFSGLYTGLLLPRLHEGYWLAVCAGVFAGLTLSIFVVAAITFSRDVLLGRWP